MTDQQKQTTDDVARLREWADYIERNPAGRCDAGEKQQVSIAMFRRAADALERLASVEAERDRLKAAVKVLRDFASTVASDPSRTNVVGAIAAKSISTADAILAGKENNPS